MMLNSLEYDAASLELAQRFLFRSLQKQNALANIPATCSPSSAATTHEEATFMKGASMKTLPSSASPPVSPTHYDMIDAERIPATTSTRSSRSAYKAQKRKEREEGDDSDSAPSSAGAFATSSAGDSADDDTGSEMEEDLFNLRDHLKVLDKLEDVVPVPEQKMFVHPSDVGKGLS